VGGSAPRRTWINHRAVDRQTAMHPPIERAKGKGNGGRWTIQAMSSPKGSCLEQHHPYSSPRLCCPRDLEIIKETWKGRWIYEKARQFGIFNRK
jgi:hypothetical protein